MQLRFNRSITAISLLCCGLLLSGCGERPAASVAKPSGHVVAKHPSTPTLIPSQSVYDFLGEIPFVKKERISNLQRMWRRVPHYSNFRVVKPDDSPESYAIHDYGEIAGAYGLALMTVDISKTSDDRFGLVVFIERPVNTYTIHWIYKDMDLRRFQMSRASGDIFVHETLSDGSTKGCEIQWTKRIGQWNCEPLN